MRGVSSGALVTVTTLNPGTVTENFPPPVIVPAETMFSLDVERNTL